MRNMNASSSAAMWHAPTRGRWVSRGETSAVSCQIGAGQRDISMPQCTPIQIPGPCGRMPIFVLPDKFLHYPFLYFINTLPRTHLESSVPSSRYSMMSTYLGRCCSWWHAFRSRFWLWQWARRNPMRRGRAVLRTTSDGRPSPITAISRSNGPNGSTAAHVVSIFRHITFH